MTFQVISRYQTIHSRPRVVKLRWAVWSNAFPFHQPKQSMLEILVATSRVSAIQPIIYQRMKEEDYSLNVWNIFLTFN